MKSILILFGIVLTGFLTLKPGVASNSEHSTPESQNTAQYTPDQNLTTYDEDPTNYPLHKPKTYTNVDQVEVQSPTQYHSVPPGVCAVCRDGSYSFSRHRQGTCSRHGGVSK